MEELESKHRKELKSLEGEKRAAIKKAKSTKGKKSKELLKELEAQYETKLQTLQAKHATEREELQAPSGDASPAAQESATNVGTVEPITTPSPQEESKPSKQSKKIAKRQQQRQRELEKQQQLQEELHNAGPSAREVELLQIQQHLPDRYAIQDVTADGHCLYRAVGVHLSQDYQQVRNGIADALVEYQDDYVAFLEDDLASYEHKLRHTAEWGGHLELQVLSRKLERPIVVYTSREILRFGEEFHDKGEPIRLSYHTSYYSLGEHYNVVVSKQECPVE